MSRASLLVAWLSAAAACAPQAIDLVGVGADRAPIYYGTSAPNDTAVVALTMRGSGAFCTGTLITPTVVLTASHCLDGLAGYQSDVGVFFGADANRTGTTIGVVRMAQHPDFSSRSLDGDVALLEMTSAAPSAITPIPHLPSNIGLTSSDIGASVRFVGYGDTETGSYGERRQQTGQVGQVCASSSGCWYGGESVVWGSFAYSQANGGPCYGDSGGPAFITRSGAQYVAGITSYGDQDCRATGVSTTVSAYQSFIDDFIGVGGGGGAGGLCTQASCMPGASCISDATCGANGFCIDAAANPEFVGGYCSASCAIHDQCAGDGMCVFNGSQGSCFDGCTSDAECRNGYACDTSNGFGVCLPVSAGGGGGGGGGGALSPSGGTCGQSTDCATPGAHCYDESYGFPGGLCSMACTTDASCGAGAHCSEGMCLESCATSGDCRTGYVCRSEARTPDLGACWVACDSDAFCEGELCNEYGLCGSATPPDVASSGGDSGSAGTAGARSGAVTTGCAAAGAEPTLVGVAALLLAARLRRVRRGAAELR